MGRRRVRRQRRDNRLVLFLVAFGAGLFLALFCSMKLVLFFAVLALIYLGIKYYTC